MYKKLPKIVLIEGKNRRGTVVLEIRKTGIVLEESDLIEVERIILDSDREEALRFIKKCVYEKILHSQQGKLKSYLDGETSPAEKFKGNASDR